MNDLKRKSEANLSDPKESKGWLPLLGAYLFTIPVWNLYDIFNMYMEIFITVPLSLLMNVDKAGAYIIIFKIASDVLLAAYSIFIIYLYFSKKKPFINSLIICYSLLFIRFMATYFLFQNSNIFNPIPISNISSFLVPALWVVYLLKSEIVKKTFVR